MSHLSMGIIDPNLPQVGQKQEPKSEGRRLVFGGGESHYLIHSDFCYEFQFNKMNRHSNLQNFSICNFFFFSVFALGKLLKRWLIKVTISR